MSRPNEDIQAVAADAAKSLRGFRAGTVRIVAATDALGREFYEVTNLVIECEVPCVTQIVHGICPNPACGKPISLLLGRDRPPRGAGSSARHY